MALKLPDFSYPQPAPSPILQAFEYGLQKLVSVPFEKAAEKRSEQRDIREEKRRADTALQTFTAQTGIASDFATREQLASDYVPSTPDLEDQLRRSNRDPAAFSRSYNGQTFLPKNVLAQAQQDNAPIDSTQANIMTTILGYAQKHGIGTQVLSPDQKQYTQREFSTTMAELDPALRVVGLQQQEELASLQRQAMAQNRADVRDDRLYNLLRQWQPERTLGFGVRKLDAQGNPTNEVEPLTFEMQVGYQNPFLGVIAAEQRGQKGNVNPEIQKFFDAQAELNRRGGVVPMPFVTDEGITTLQNMVTPTSPAMQGYSAMAIRYGMATDPSGQHATRDPAEAAAFLQANPQALRALIAYTAFPNGMNDIVNSQKIPGAAHFDPTTLGYLRNIFRANNLPSDFPGLNVQSNIVSPTPGVGRDASGIRTPTPDGRPHEPGVILPPIELAPPTGLSPEDTSEYVKFAQSAANRMRNDPSYYETAQNTINQVLTSPDAAAKFFREANVPAEQLRLLTSGTPSQRQNEYLRLKRLAIWALQDAHNALYGQSK